MAEAGSEVENWPIMEEEVRRSCNEVRKSPKGDLSVAVTCLILGCSAPQAQPGGKRPEKKKRRRKKTKKDPRSLLFAL